MRRLSATVTNVRRPDRSITGSDIQKVFIGIVGHAIPHGSAAALLPPFTGPRFRCGFHGFVLESLRRIAGRDVELPEFFAGVHIECGNVSTKRRKFGAGIADEDLALRDAGRHRDGVRGDLALFRLRDRPRRPQELSGRGVQSLHASVDDGDKHLAFVQRNAAAIHTTTKARLSLLRHRSIRLRVIAPDLFAGFRVDGGDDAPVRNGIEDSVRIERSRLLAAATGTEFIRPGECKFADILGIDLSHGAVALLAPVHPVAQPFRAFSCVLQRLVVNLFDLLLNGQRRPG